jgi:hypothetical protein
MDQQQQDRQTFERTVSALQGEMALAGSITIQDSAVRSKYQRQIERLVGDLRRDAEAGRLTWAEAAEQARLTRNATMELMRGQSSAIGRAVAEKLKSEGKTLNELIARYTIKRFGGSAQFDALSAADRDLIFADVVQAAARANPQISARMLMLSRAGRGLILLSVAISVYNIYEAKDHVAAATKEVVVTGGGILGGMAGGALAGLACGPGAPVCVTVGAFVGGAIAAIGIGAWW